MGLREGNQSSRNLSAWAAPHPPALSSTSQTVLLAASETMLPQRGSGGPTGVPTGAWESQCREAVHASHTLTLPWRENQHS